MTTNMMHLVGYGGVKTALALAVLSLPSPPMYHHEPPLAIVTCALVVCTACYLLLQGSDPGYLTEELLRRAMEAEEEEGNLLATEEEDDDNDNEHDDSDALRPTAARDNAAERRYRRGRIQQIQVALKQLETRNPQAAGDDGDDVELDMMDTLDLEAPAGSHPVKEQEDALERFCVECSIFPPLRSHHCRSCGRCVATFDHHCFLVSACIGERNHGRFWWFLLFQTLELTLGVLVVVARFQPRTAKSSWTHTNGWPIFLLVILALLLTFVGSMLAFHTFLAMTSMTTYEFGRGPDKIPYLRGFRECDLPFSRGLLTNLTAFCFPQRASISSCFTAASSNDSRSPGTSKQRDHAWRPVLWRTPTPVDRDSDKICENLWENKYYSCC